MLRAICRAAARLAPFASACLVASGLVATGLVAALPVFAQQPSDFIYDAFVNECRKAGGTPRTSRAELNGGAKFQCDRNTTGAAAPGPASGGCNQQEAKTNIDWVFSDGGARGTYQNGRGRGLSALDAVLQAQAHNARARQSIANCGPWATNYLAGLGGGNNNVNNNGPPLSNRQLSAADCACVSIVRTGSNDQYPAYRVSNNCAAMKIDVRFVGDLGPTIPNSAQQDFQFSQWTSAGIVAQGGARVIKAPAWAIVSIRASQLEAATSKVVCPYVP